EPELLDEPPDDELEDELEDDVEGVGELELLELGFVAELDLAGLPEAFAAARESVW
ncbi:MAG: hypothetical protein ACJAS7_000451, partial [Alpinimonas sp.]